MFPLLETLVAVYEVGQFTLAADELKVSQSTVSSRIAQLEQMVGAPLFVRNAKSDVTPTQAGRMLYQTAIGIDGLWRDTREQIARVQEAREPLAVSFSHTTAAILLPKALPVMARDMDGFDFAVHVMNSDAILEQASMKAVQLGVVEKPIVNDSVDRSPCARTGWCWRGSLTACGWCANTVPACGITRICISRPCRVCRLAPWRCPAMPRLRRRCLPALGSR